LLASVIVMGDPMSRPLGNLEPHAGAVVIAGHRSRWRRCDGLLRFHRRLTGWSGGCLQSEHRRLVVLRDWANQQCQYDKNQRDKAEQCQPDHATPETMLRRSHDHDDSPFNALALRDLVFRSASEMKPRMLAPR
jgi:hypothetical protein